MAFYKEKLLRFIAIIPLLKKKKSKRVDSNSKNKATFRSDILIKGSDAFNELPTSLLALFIQYSIKFRSIELTPSFRPTPRRPLLPRRSSFPAETWNDMAEDKMETCPSPLPFPFPNRRFLKQGRSFMYTPYHEQKQMTKERGW